MPRVRFARAIPILAAVAAALFWLAIAWSAEPFEAGSFGPGHDARAYWLAARVADPYAAGEHWGHLGAYVYSPAFLQLAGLLVALPWGAFVAAWSAIALAVLGWLSAGRAMALMLVFAVPELWGGNVHLLLAAAIALGVRFPAVWAFVLLTKVTPGVGLLWFVMRREWRPLAVAAGATALVVVVSAAIAPDLWERWFRVLSENAGQDPHVFGVIPIPLVVRLPLAVALIAWAAPRDERWALPVACMLALPAWWVGGFAMLLAIPRLLDWKLPERLPSRLGRVARLAGIEPAA